MKIECDGITLRDYQVSDIEDEIRWSTADTSWFYEDTPWMTMDPVNPDELRRDMMEVISGMSDDAIRWRLEIEVNGRHVGFVSSYLLDEHFQATPRELIDPHKNAVENHSVRALGIEICEADCRGQGIARSRLPLLWSITGVSASIASCLKHGAEMPGCSDVPKSWGLLRSGEKKAHIRSVEKRMIQS